MLKKSPVEELGLVLEPDPVPGFMVPHHMLEDHDLQYLPSLIMEELVLAYQSSYPGIYSVDAFIGQLAHI